MSVIYQCDLCTIPISEEEAQGYRLEIEDFRIVIRPEGHLCPPCFVRLLQRAAQLSSRADVLAGVGQ